jgi:hypothetical protein
VEHGAPMASDEECVGDGGGAGLQHFDSIRTSELEHAESRCADDMILWCEVQFLICA